MEIHDVGFQTLPEKPVESQKQPAAFKGPLLPELFPAVFQETPGLLRQYLCRLLITLQDFLRRAGTGFTGEESVCGKTLADFGENQPFPFVVAGFQA